MLLFALHTQHWKGGLVGKTRTPVFGDIEDSKRIISQIRAGAVMRVFVALTWSIKPGAMPNVIC